MKPDRRLSFAAHGAIIDPVTLPEPILVYCGVLGNQYRRRVWRVETPDLKWIYCGTVAESKRFALSHKDKTQ